jgi:DNA-binding CsgD family transcriptional regulator/tetratricopeptide (TPR) repeat protein
VDGLLGRGAEGGRLDHLLDDARDGLSGALVLRGEPGVGKTALLDYAQAAAADLLVIRVDGVETEMELSFAALHQFLRSCLGGLDLLPAPQQTALRLAFGMQEGPVPDRFLVGLAALSLLAGHTAGKPLLCLIDDAHCLDRESADALAFVARRVYADSIAIVFAVREPAPQPSLLDGLPELRLAGLAAADARELLMSAAGSQLDRPVAERIVAETGGNPLALIEIGQEFASGQLGADVPLPEPVPLGRQLEQRYLREVQGLPAGTQSLLLAAAADPTGDPGLLWQAGQELGFTIEAAAPAEARQLITIRDTIRFRHPLIRSAVYYGASSAQRQRIHARLAAATSPAEPDQRAWHLAQAATGPDEAVAEELEHAGERARRRCGWTMAAGFFHRAATLSASQAARARRMLSAAEANCNAGALSRAQAELDAAAAYRDDAGHHGLVQRVQGRIQHALRQPAKATSAFLAAATTLGPVDSRLARDILVEAIVEAQINGRLAPSGATGTDVAHVAQALPRLPGTTATAGDLLLDADMTLQLDGLDAAAPLLRQAIDAVRHETADPAEIFQWLAAACADATILGDEPRLHELTRRIEAAARHRGAMVLLSLALSYAGARGLLAGDLAETERCFTEMTAISDARGQPWSLGTLLCSAWRGQPEQTYALLDTVSGEAGRQGQGYQLVFADYARCILELGHGRYDAAYASFASGIDDTSQIKFALPDLVEAAQRSGHPDVARDAVRLLTRLATGNPGPVTLGFLSRAQALVAGDDPGAYAEAEDHYQDAINQHGQAPGPAHLARSHLVYGEWLRRAKRPRAARDSLRIAHRLFEEIGAQAFARRARLELSAAGETVPARAARRGHDLTPQEEQVARLAAGGATNAEIAGQLYLSPNTVDYHLRKVFRKLGITSRRHLARALLPGPVRRDNRPAAGRLRFGQFELGQRGVGGEEPAASAADHDRADHQGELVEQPLLDQ